MWGGSPNCEHVWASTRYYREISAAVDSDEAFEGAGEDNAERLKTARWREDSTCSVCGAWLGELGLEPTLDLYIEHIVEVFREVFRVLRDDATLWLNLGDTYSGSGKSGNRQGKQGSNVGSHDKPGRRPNASGFKRKELMGIPWRVVFALQDNGWCLRRDIVWQKANAMPESSRDRPSSCHEFIFLLSKPAGRKRLWRNNLTGEWVYKKPNMKLYASVSDKQVRVWRGFDYLYDADAIAEPCSLNTHARMKREGKGVDVGGLASGAVSHTAIDFTHPVTGGFRGVSPKSKMIVTHTPGGSQPQPRSNESFSAAVVGIVSHRNSRDVWSIPSRGYKGLHFATFPPELPRRCILASTKPGDIVLDLFSGSGTTSAEAVRLGRVAVAQELKDGYHSLIRDRVSEVTLPMDFGGAA